MRIVAERWFELKNEINAVFFKNQNLALHFLVEGGYIGQSISKMRNPEIVMNFFYVKHYFRGKNNVERLTREGS